MRVIVEAWILVRRYRNSKKKYLPSVFQTTEEFLCVDKELLVYVNAYKDDALVFSFKEQAELFGKSWDMKKKPKWEAIRISIELNEKGGIKCIF